MRYTFDITTGRRGLGSVDIDLTDEEVKTIKEMIAETGEFILDELEDYDSRLFDKILDASNDAAEVAIKNIFKEQAEANGEEFDEENFEVDWQNENVYIDCPEEWLEECGVNDD